MLPQVPLKRDVEINDSKTEHTKPDAPLKGRALSSRSCESVLIERVKVKWIVEALKAIWDPHAYLSLRHEGAMYLAHRQVQVHPQQVFQHVGCEDFGDASFLEWKTGRGGNQVGAPTPVHVDANVSWDPCRAATKVQLEPTHRGLRLIQVRCSQG